MGRTTRRRFCHVLLAMMLASSLVAGGQALAGAAGDEEDDTAKAMKAGLDISLKADLKGIAALTGLETLEAFAIVSKAANPYLWRDGKFHPATAKPQTFNAAVAHVTAETIARAESLLLEKGDYPKALAFVCLVGAASHFVAEPGKVHTAAFDAALASLSKEKMERARDLVNDPDASEPLFILLLAAGFYVDAEGRFRGDAFHKVLDALTPADVADLRKKSEGRLGEQALYLLLRDRSKPSTSPR